jgi:hypothetical protein
MISISSLLACQEEPKSLSVEKDKGDDVFSGSRILQIHIE